MNPCTEREALELVLAGEGEPLARRAAEAHVATCAACLRDRRAIEAAARVVAARPVSDPEAHPDPDALVRHALGSGTAAEREPLRGHLARCPDCAEDAADLSSASGDVLSSPGRLLPGPAAGWKRILPALGWAAALLLLLPAIHGFLPDAPGVRTDVRILPLLEPARAEGLDEPAAPAGPLLLLLPVTFSPEGIARFRFVGEALESGESPFHFQLERLVLDGAGRTSFLVERPLAPGRYRLRVEGERGGTWEVLSTFAFRIE